MKQISIIIGDSVSHVESTIQEANQLLGVDGKSLEFLRKSYNRLSVTFKAGQIFGSTEKPAIK